MLRLRDYSRPHRVILHIPQGNGKVARRQHRAVKPRLPHVPAAPVARVPILRIAPVEPAEEHGQRVAVLRNHNKMNVIRHQAPGRDAHPGVALVLAEQVQVDAAVGGGAEDDLAIGSALRDMMGESGNDVPRVARHAE